MGKIRQGKGEKRGISIVKGSSGRGGHLRVTDSPEERERKKKDPLRINTGVFKMKKPKMKNPFKM